MEKTEELFDKIMMDCKQTFQTKTKDYGASWLLFRLSSLTDQILIKAKRIRTLETKEAKVDEGIDSEYKGIINYCIMALTTLWHKNEIPESEKILQDEKIDIDPEKMNSFYDNAVSKVRELLIKKNHDYGEAWKNMRLSSINDELLVRTFRIRHIDKNGNLISSEGLDAQYSDILIFCIFALIHLDNPNLSESQ